MPARFYCTDISGDIALLDDAESHHALHVLRLAHGDTVELFDGRGTVARGFIAEATRRTARITVHESWTEAPRNRPRLTVAAAPPRGDRFRTMVEKLTEIGVDEYIPLNTIRSVVDPRQSRLDRLQSTIISTLKQSGRNRLMLVRSVTDLSSVLRSARKAGDAVHIAHPGQNPSGHLAVSTRNVVLLIGPEGGFTSEELLQATDHGATCLSWKDGILRTETAALVFASLLLRTFQEEVRRAGH